MPAWCSAVLKFLLVLSLLSSVMAFFLLRGASLKKADFPGASRSNLVAPSDDVRAEDAFELGALKRAVDQEAAEKMARLWKEHKKITARKRREEEAVRARLQTSGQSEGEEKEAAAKQSARAAAAARASAAKADADAMVEVVALESLYDYGGIGEGDACALSVHQMVQGLRKEEGWWHIRMPGTPDQECRIPSSFLTKSVSAEVQLAEKTTLWRQAHIMRPPRLKGSLLSMQCNDVEVNGRVIEGIDKLQHTFACERACLDHHECDGMVHADNGCTLMTQIQGMRALNSSSASVFKHKLGKSLKCPRRTPQQHKRSLLRYLRENFPDQQWKDTQMDILYAAKNGDMQQIWMEVGHRDNAETNNSPVHEEL